MPDSNESDGSYDPLLARFLSPDDIIPYATNLQAYNRCSYVHNNPLAFTDPSGHIATGGSAELGDIADGAGAEADDEETNITVSEIIDGFTHGWGVIATELADPADPTSEDRDIYGHTNHGPDDDVPDSGTDGDETATVGPGGNSPAPSDNLNLDPPPEPEDEPVQIAACLPCAAFLVQPTINALGFTAGILGIGLGAQKAAENWGGSISLSEDQRFSDEKRDLVEMAKRDKKSRSGVTQEDMDAYEELNRDLPDPFEEDQVRSDPGHKRGGKHSREPHGHVGPVDHIPIN